jgi:2-dehydro-3-deoxyphosphogluconate aldolase/(4S)-4-hydroxy-2-oxoglutarate aldolase
MLPKEEAIQAMLSVGIVAVVRLDNANDLVATAEAIQAGGIKAIEFTMTTPGALEMLKEASKRLSGETVLGAGTVLDNETAREVILAGAKFIVSPITDFATITLAKRYSIAVAPGAFSPTEVVKAWQAGADLVKVFPASLGGASFIKALLSPLPQIKLLPTGGVNLDTAAAFIKAGAAALAVGGNLVDKTAIRMGNFEAITQRAQKYVQIIEQARSEM